jgi:hypothetical protein
MAAVETVMGAIECDLKMSVTACAEDDGLFPTLVDRPVADKPDISVDEIAVGFENLLQMR